MSSTLHSNDGSAVTVGMLYGSRVAHALVGVATAVIVARALGPEQRGWYFLAVTVALGAFVIVHLSLDQGAFWAIAERAGQVRQLWPMLTLGAVAGTLIAAAGYTALAGSGLLLDGVPLGTVVAAILVIPVSLVQQLSAGLIYALGQARVAAVGIAATAAVQLGGTVMLVVVDRLDSTTAVGVLVIGTLVGAVPMVAALGAQRRDDEPRQTSFTRSELLRVSLQNHIGVASIWLARRADILVISVLVSATELGIYTLAVTLAEFVLLSADAIAQTALGRQGSLERGDSGRWSVALAADSTRIALAQAVVLAALGWPILRYGFGRDWLDAYPALLALLPGIVALAYVRPLLATFVRGGRSLEASIAIAGAAALKIAATALVADRFGLVAVAGASSAAWISAAVLIMWRARIGLGLRLWAPSLMPGVIERLRGT